MTARTAVAIGSLTVALCSGGCLSFYEVPVDIPIQAKIDVTSYQRVLVAGFLTGGTPSIDPNTETARLLRSQLRTKQDLRVLDAEVLSLVEEVEKRRGLAVAPAGPADEPRIKNADDLKAYQEIFSDSAFWRELGADYDQPLIVTGSVLFTEVTRSGMVSRPQSFVDQQGMEQFRSVREYSDLKGFALSSTFVFIDGRSGELLYSESYDEETLYPAGQNTPALSSYFELMDKLLPSFLNTLSTQRIRGTRVLLK